MLKLVSALFLFIVSTPVMSANLHKGGAELLNPKAYSMNVTGKIFQTSAYFDNEGVETTLPEGNEYSLMDLDLSASYGISKNLQITGMGRFRNVSSTVNTVTTDKSGPESLGVEAKYSFEPVGNTHWAMGVHYRQTLYSETSYDTTAQVPIDEVILGDSGSEYGFDLYVTHNAGALKWDGKIGYSSPANDLSDEIPYKFEGMYRFSKLGLLAGVEGVFSLKKDQYAEVPANKPLQSVGATHLFNSINREYMAPYVGANYAFEKVIVGLKGQSIMNGTSTDKGSAFIISLGWSSEGETPEAVKENAFKEYQVEGSVLKVSARGNFIRIDQGLSTDVEKGMKFDIYQTDYFGGNLLVASGIVYDVGADWSIIKLTKKYKEIEIKPGFAARGF